MRRADRLFEIIQILRAAPAPVTAEALAERLEVSVRTVYRDMAALQAMRTPVEGAAGVGYLLRAGYDLPPLNFDVEEIEAIAVGLSLLARTGDAGLQKSARRVAAKLDAFKRQPAAPYVSRWGAPTPSGVEPAALRQAIREERALRLTYRSESGAVTGREVRPFAMIYHIEATLLAAFCELRQDFRHFRQDRMLHCELLERRFLGEGAGLRARWDARELMGRDLHRLQL